MWARLRAGHAAKPIARAWGWSIQVYFCDSKSPWQPGSNESANGLLGQYLHRTLDFRILTQADFDAIADQLKGRIDRPPASRDHHQNWPRRCVDRLSPQTRQ